MGIKRNAFFQYLAVSAVATLLLALVWWKRPSGSFHWESAIVWGAILFNSVGRPDSRKYRVLLSLWAVGVLFIAIIAWKWPNASGLWDMAIMSGLLLVYFAIDSPRRKRLRNENISSAQ